MNNQSSFALIRTKGTPKRGGSLGGECWRIENNGQRAGIVFINVVDTAPLGPHASIQIFLNARSQGQGIGRWAIRQACLESRHKTIYAHISKKNLASQKSATAAGFTDVTPPDYRQLIFCWNS